MGLYGDDLLIAGSNVREINVDVGMLSKKSQMAKSEKISVFLDIRMHFTSDGCF